jgi:DedD protein
MDRGLKERLIGAAVLVAVGAWLIPWVLDGPESTGRPQATSLELPTPVGEGPPMRSQTVVLDQQRESPNAASQPAELASSTTPAAPIAGAPAEVRDEPAAAPSAAATPPPLETAAEDRADEPAAQTAGTAWFVQLGSFGEAENASRLAARVETFGFDADVSAFRGSGRELHRVRVGPEPTRQRAEAIASSLSTHGFVAQVIFE